MIDRQEIAKRHGIPEQADKLVGETAEALEADAAARSAIASMFRPLTPAVPVEESPATEDESEAFESEPALPPGDKPFDQYTEADWAATRAESERRLTTPPPTAPDLSGLNPIHQQLGYTNYDLAKAQQHSELVRLFHPTDEEQAA